MAFLYRFTDYKKAVYYEIAIDFRFTYLNVPTLLDIYFSKNKYLYIIILIYYIYFYAVIFHISFGFSLF